MEKTFIFTFCNNSPNGGHYVKIKGTFNSARQRMFDLFGSNWAFQYLEEEWEELILSSVYPIETEISIEEALANVRK